MFGEGARVGVQTAKAAEPLPATVYAGNADYRKDVRDGFLSLTEKFKYLTFTDEADITSQCTSKGTLLCADHPERASGAACLTTSGSDFPARQSCVDEFKKNLADIALWLDTSASGFSGSSPSTDADGNVVLDVFHTTHVAVMGADTENSLNKNNA